MNGLFANGTQQVGELSGNYWNIQNPISVEPVNITATPTKPVLSMRIKGDSAFNGAMHVEEAYIALGNKPQFPFRAQIPNNSLLIDGVDAGGRLSASVTEMLSPITSKIVACEIASGNMNGSTPISLTHSFQFGMVGGYTSSSTSGNAPSPNKIYIESKTLKSEFLLHCSTDSAVPGGQTYTYTANVVFFHAIVAEGSGL